MAHPGGRPTMYTEELADEICETIATSANGLIALCAENPHWPVREVIYRWKRKHAQFSLKYTQAKMDQIEPLIDQCLDIADDTSRDSIVKKDQDGNEYEACNNEWINRSRLRIDTRKWFASKLAPKIYGDHLSQSHDVTVRQDEILQKAKENIDSYGNK